MIELQKGDISNLKGTVKIYSIYKKLTSGKYTTEKGDDLPDGVIFSFYCSSIINKFIEETNWSEYDAKHHMMEICSEEERNIKVYHAFRLYTHLDQFNEEINQKNEDVLYTGIYSSPFLCKDMSIFSMQIYYLSLIEQNFINSQNNKEGLKNKVYLPSYGHSKNNLKYILTNHFIKPMFEAVSIGDKKSFDKISEDIFDYFKEVPFKQDIENIVRNIMSKNCNGILVEAYMDKVVALANENYDTAQSLQEKIIKMEYQKNP